MVFQDEIYAIQFSRFFVTCITFKKITHPANLVKINNWQFRQILHYNRPYETCFREFFIMGRSKTF